MYANKQLRRHQTFVFDDWLGGFYASPNLQGSRSGMPMATAWAVMAHLGIDGYVELTRTTLETADRLRSAITATDGIRVMGLGRYHLVAMESDPTSPNPIDVFALCDALASRGWFHDRQTPPDSLHSTVSNGNAAVIDDYVRALAECAADVRGERANDRSTTYATLE